MLSVGVRSESLTRKFRAEELGLCRIRSSCGALGVDLRSLEVVLYFDLNQVSGKARFESAGSFGLLRREFIHSFPRQCFPNLVIDISIVNQ